MNDCCDNKCNQGRDCPAQVAPVKCSYPRYEDDYYLQAWVNNLINQKETDGWFSEIMLVIVLLICFGFIGILAFVVN